MPGPTDPPDWQKQNQGKSASAFDRARQLHQERQKEPSGPQRGSAKLDRARELKDAAQQRRTEQSHERGRGEKER